ncbi:MAG TPA: hypothetical protein IAB02_08500 [Candidatus Pullichristensenella excrementigallinarum]|uniref:DUF5666 domain-containing protein n=1 Tax=Candidatus Pullichristensenella excrementigallinarum TaxID=2840907 RepID=A0A9D1IEU2_9FIRM|nr:hypothetical protein [Candidatus Pullichristensenella excrementigallinarum]
MKKCLALLMILALAIPFAFAEEGAQEIMSFHLEGWILEVQEDGILMDMGDSGEVMVLLSEDTVIENTEDSLAAGQYALVDYDGQMTRSRPAQITADKISVYAVHGTVAEVSEEGILVSSKENGDVFATLPEGMGLEVGQEVTIYFNGVMTMSLPPRINALAVEILMEEAQTQEA